MSRRVEETFFWSRHINGQQTHDRYSTILVIRETQVRAQWDIMSHLLEWLLSKGQEITSFGKDVENRQHSHTIGGNTNQCSHYRKQSGDFSKN